MQKSKDVEYIVLVITFLTEKKSPNRIELINVNGSPGILNSRAKYEPLNSLTRREKSGTEY
ncbi:MAG: hypothetical protein IPH84_13350 [Bacteroidales bacterium]|nr:hypothetical protein [Bacteroidales bacterium]